MSSTDEPQTPSRDAEEATPETPPTTDNATPDSPSTPGGSLNDIFYSNLVTGFNLMQSREPGFAEEEPPDEEQQIHNCAVVNFVDPSSAAASLVTASGAPAKEPLELYQRMENIFKTEYASKLTYVQHKHLRSGASGVIEALSVKPMLTLGGLMSLHQDVPWKTAATSDSPPDRTDPTEFHNAPYCHVYLASCESLEQYRNQVKPSVKAFASQLEAAAEEVAVAAGMAESGVVSKKQGRSPYVIVFIPTGDNKDEVVGAASRVGAAFSRLRAARTGAVKAAETPTGSSTTNGDTEHSDLASEADTEEAAGNLVQGHLSKVDKEIARRLSVDFPSARLCTLSSLFDEKKDAEHDERKKLEWSAFMKTLGAAIVDGFTERCRRYDDYLRKMDAQRASSTNGDKKNFDLKHYFLVKESLAVSYEQMQLASEALLQYHELRALVPDIKSSDVEDETFARMAGNVDSDSAFLRNALAGEPRGFRRYFRELDDLEPVAPILEQYLYSRETSLLFKTGDAVEVISRALSFVETMFRFRSRCATIGEKAQQNQVVLATEKWAFDFCWDFRRATKSYFDFKASPSATPEAIDLQLRFARQLSDLFEFARLRFIRLGDLSLEKHNPVKGDGILMPEAGEWPSYEKPLEFVEIPLAENLEGSTQSDFAQEAIETTDNYLRNYLAVVSYLAETNEFCNRKRTAAYRRLEAANVCLQLGLKPQAARYMKSIAVSFERNCWHDAAFLFRFRFAGLQRYLSSPEDYLTTLVMSFSPTAKRVAPEKALLALQRDFLSVVTIAQSVNPKFEYISSSSSAFDPAISIEGLSSKHLSNEEEFSRILLNIGNTVTLNLALESHIPADVPVEKITLDLVSFKKYMSSKEDEVTLTSKDAYKVLVLEPGVLHPGTNNLKATWLPLEPETLIVASVSIRLNNAVSFVYQARKLRQATLRVDVVPCDATQTLDVVPSFLLSGQDQDVTVRLNANTDNVRRGQFEIVCLGGATIADGDEAEKKWKSGHAVSFKDCSPNDSFEYKFRCRVPLPDECPTDGSPPSLHVKALSSFEFAFVGGAEANQIAQMDHTLEVSAEATGSSTFLLERSELSNFSTRGLMLNLIILSRAKQPLTLQGWTIELPETLKVSKNGDVNESFAGSSITDGGRIGMCFICERTQVDEKEVGSATLTMEFTDEHDSKFTESLEVDIDSIGETIVVTEGKNDVIVAVAPVSPNARTSSPVSLRYTLQQSDLKEFSGRLTYSIETEHPDWLVSGRAEGAIDKPSGLECYVDVDAIPCRPGNLASFPKLFLYQWERTTETLGKLVPTQQMQGTEFQSTALDSQITVACPTNNKKMYTV